MRGAHEQSTEDDARTPKHLRSHGLCLLDRPTSPAQAPATASSATSPVASPKVASAGSAIPVALTTGSGTNTVRDARRQVTLRFQRIAVSDNAAAPNERRLQDGAVVVERPEGVGC